MNHSLLYMYLQRLDIRTMAVSGKNCLRVYNRLVPFGLKRYCLPREFSGIDVTFDESTPTKLKNNPYYQKYMFKIEKLKQEDPEKYHKIIKQLESSTEFESTDDTESTGPTTTHKKKNSPTNASPKSVNTSDVCSEHESSRKGLDSIIKLDLISELSAEDISKVWVDHFSTKDAVCAVIPVDTFTIIRTVAEVYPVFIYPLPRKNGYEMFMCQYSGNDFHFTSLHNFQKYKEYAPNQLTLRHYTELQDEKGIILMSGQLIDETLSVTDAQFLSYQIQHFCTQRPDLIRNFNTNPDTFKVNDIISALDDISNFVNK